MMKPSNAAHDLPSMHIKPFRIHVGLAALRRGLAVDPMLASRPPTTLGSDERSLQFARRRQSR